MSAKPVVVIGILGATLDGGLGPRRWERWRPNIAMCSHPDLIVDRVELLSQAAFTKLGARVVADLAEVSPETEVNTHILDVEDAWDLEEMYGALLDFAQSYRFKPKHEDYLVHITTGTHIAQISNFLLAEARYIPAKILQTSPPAKRDRDKPGTFRIIDLDLSKYDRIAQRFRTEQREGISFLKSGIDTLNPGFNDLIEQLEHVAIASRDPLLLTGPTGAGKSQLARRVFELKKSRRQVAGEFVDVNCATLRGDGAMSALFGHVKGAFTGASRARAGHLFAADGGLLFLDEIGELGLDEQAMLLRAVEDKVFYPVGSDKSIRSDFQLIAGTNRDLAAALERGEFREDLLARINLWTVELPGLCERREDIEPNLEYELSEARRSFGHNITMSREGKVRFLQFAKSPAAKWTANFRDLNAAVRRMATLCKGGRITVVDVGREMDRLRRSWGGSSAKAEESQRAIHYLGSAAAALDDFDREQLNYVLRVCQDSKSLADAGKKLFAVSRTLKKSSNDSDRIRKYLARFGLSWSKLS